MRQLRSRSGAASSAAPGTRRGTTRRCALTWRYFDSVKLDASNPNPALASSFFPADAKLGAQNYIDLAFSWNINKNFTIYAGANNIFDRDPPIRQLRSSPARRLAMATPIRRSTTRWAATLRSTSRPSSDRNTRLAGTSAAIINAASFGSPHFLAGDPVIHFVAVNPDVNPCHAMAEFRHPFCRNATPAAFHSPGIDGRRRPSALGNRTVRSRTNGVTTRKGIPAILRCRWWHDTVNRRTTASPGPMGATPHLARCPYVRQVLAALGAPIGRSRLMRLDSGAEATAHVDTNYYWSQRVRVHIPDRDDARRAFSVWRCGNPHGAGRSLDLRHLAPAQRAESARESNAYTWSSTRLAATRSGPGARPGARPRPLVRLRSRRTSRP